MANQIIEPVMGLILPTPGVQPGPQYATDTNQDMSIIASHTHQPGSGVAITPAGMDINAPLSFNSNPLFLHLWPFSSRAGGNYYTPELCCN